MMPSKTLITAGTLVGLLLPLGGAAYTPPNEVLTNENVYEGFILPPNKRTVQQRKEEQQRRSQQQREQAQAGFGEEEEPAGTDDPEPAPTTDGKPASLEDILQSLEESLSLFTEQQNSTEAKRRQRLLERIEMEQELYGAAGMEFQYGNTGMLPSRLHGGAPLAPTGPASIAAGICLAAAGLWTVIRAGRVDTKS